MGKKLDNAISSLNSRVYLHGTYDGLQEGVGLKAVLRSLHCYHFEGVLV